MAAASRSFRRTPSRGGRPPDPLPRLWEMRLVGRGDQGDVGFEIGRKPESGQQRSRRCALTGDQAKPIDHGHDQRPTATMRVAFAKPRHGPTKPPESARRGRRHRHRIRRVLQDVTGHAIHVPIFAHQAVEQADDSRRRPSNRHRPDELSFQHVDTSRRYRSRHAGGALRVLGWGGPWVDAWRSRQPVPEFRGGRHEPWDCRRTARRLEPGHRALSAMGAGKQCWRTTPSQRGDRWLFVQRRVGVRSAWAGGRMRRSVRSAYALRLPDRSDEHHVVGAARPLEGR